jgi:hypothetical protein
LAVKKSRSFLIGKLSHFFRFAMTHVVEIASLKSIVLLVSDD